MKLSTIISFAAGLYFLILSHSKSHNEKITQSEGVQFAEKRRKTLKKCGVFLIILSGIALVYILLFQP